MSRWCRSAAVMAATAVVAAATAACSSTVSIDERIVVDSLQVTSSGVTPAPERTYEYDFSGVRPDSVLPALWKAGIRVGTAWRPLDYRCEDVRGPRLTVQLEEPDERMAEHDFSPGTGRLACSERLMRYTLTVIG